MPHPVDLHVTCPDEGTARTLGAAAVTARLAACANVSGPVQSVFHWQGQVEEETERLLTLKTREGCVDALVELIRARHPYDTPAIAWAPFRADEATTAWIRSETGG